jgi:hypothetical protein
MSRRSTQNEFEPTPTPVAESSERMRAVARHEAMSVALEHEKECAASGPVCKVWEAIDALRDADKKRGDEMGAIREELAESRGAAKQQARNLAIIVAVFGAVNVLVGAFGLISKLWGHG